MFFADMLTFQYFAKNELAGSCRHNILGGKNIFVQLIVPELKIVKTTIKSVSRQFQSKSGLMNMIKGFDFPRNLIDFSFFRNSIEPLYLSGHWLIRCQGQVSCFRF